MSLSLESKVSQLKNNGNQIFFPFPVRVKLNSIGGAISFDITRVLIKSCRSAHARVMANEEKKKMLRYQEMKRSSVAEKQQADAKENNKHLESTEELLKYA